MLMDDSASFLLRLVFPLSNIRYNDVEWKSKHIRQNQDFITSCFAHAFAGIHTNEALC